MTSGAENRGLADRIAGLVISIVVESNCEAIAKLDEIVRSNQPAILGLQPRLELIDLDRKATIRVLEANRESLGLAVVLSFNRDGYLREAAVRSLVRFPIDEVIGYLLIRAADWVPVTAGLARNCLLARLPDSSVNGLTSGLPAYEAILRHRFVRGATAASAFRREIESRPGLIKTVRKIAPKRLRLALLREHIIGPDEDWFSILKEELESRNQSCVAEALSAVCKLSETEKGEFLTPLVRSKSSIARAKAMELADRADKLEVLWLGVADSNWRVRNDARFFLRRRGHKEFTQFYQAKFPEPSAVSGFGEAASELEILRLLPFVSHQSSVVRRAAINILGQREILDAATVIRGRLNDPVASVISASVASLGRLHFSLTLDEALELIQQAPSSLPVKRATLGMVMLLPRWDQPLLLLHAGVTWNSELNIETRLRVWLSRKSKFIYAPTANHVREIRSLVNSPQRVLGQETRQSILDELEYWKNRTPTVLDPIDAAPRIALQEGDEKESH